MVLYSEYLTGPQSQSLATGRSEYKPASSITSQTPQQTAPASTGGYKGGGQIRTFSEFREAAGMQPVSEGLDTGRSEYGVNIATKQPGGTPKTSTTVHYLTREGVPPNSIQPATPEESAEMARQKNPIVRFTRGLTRGFTLGPEAMRQTEEDIRRFTARKRETTTPEEIGLFSGGVLTLAGTKLLGPLRTGVKATAVAVERGFNVIGKLPTIGRLGVDLLLTGVAAEGTRRGTEASVRKRDITVEEKLLIKETPDFMKLVTGASNAERRNIQKTNILKGIAYEISSGLLVSDKESFRTSVKEQLKERGITGSTAEDILKTAEKERRARVTGEAAGIFTANVASELIGQKEVNIMIQAQAGRAIAGKGQLFSKFFTPMARAGIVEGTIAEFSQQQARRDTRPFLPQKQSVADFMGDLIPFGKTAEQIAAAETRRGRAFDISISGAAGGLTAGTIGGAIATTRASKPVVSKTIEIGSYLMDLFEKPADMMADAIEWGFSSITGVARKIPVVTTTAVNTQLFNLAIGRKGTKEGSISIATPVDAAQDGGGSVQLKGPAMQPAKPSKQESPTNTLIDIMNEQQKTKAKTKTPVNQPTSIGDLIGRPRGKTTINILADIFTPAETPTDTPAETPTDTPVKTPVKTEVPPTNPVDTIINVPANTFTSIFTPTAVPVITPMLRAPLPLLPGLPGIIGSTAGAGKAKKRATYIDELTAGQRLLEKFTGPVFSFSKPKRGKKTKAPVMVIDPLGVFSNSKAKGGAVFDPLGLFQ